MANKEPGPRKHPFQFFLEDIFVGKNLAADDAALRVNHAVVDGTIHVAFLFA
ncbi:hypothetical protein D3C86_2031440 [compost metagenome]